MLKKNKILKFPDKEYILRCHKCKINAFYVILNSDDWLDIKGFECAECGWYTPIESIQIIKKG